MSNESLTISGRGGNTLTIPENARRLIVDTGAPELKEIEELRDYVHRKFEFRWNRIWGTNGGKVNPAGPTVEGHKHDGGACTLRNDAGDRVNIYAVREENGILTVYLWISVYRKPETDEQRNRWGSFDEREQQAEEKVNEVEQGIAGRFREVPVWNGTIAGITADELPDRIWKAYRSVPMYRIGGYASILEDRKGGGKKYGDHPERFEIGLLAKEVNDSDSRNLTRIYIWPEIARDRCRTKALEHLVELSFELEETDAQNAAEWKAMREFFEEIKEPVQNAQKKTDDPPYIEPWKNLPDPSDYDSDEAFMSDLRTHLVEWKGTHGRDTKTGFPNGTFGKLANQFNGWPPKWKLKKWFKLEDL
jgi:hypothetical protein